MDLADTLAISRIKGVGDSSLIKLIQFSSTNEIKSFELLLNNDLRGVVSPKALQALSAVNVVRDFNVARDAAEKDLVLWQNKEISTVFINSNRYPKHLLALKDPPPFLFCKGNLNLLTETKSIAVVGTRNNSSKGKIIAQRTVGAFQSQHCVVVSGLAKGIDSIAHRAAIDIGMPTIAVVVDVEDISPSTNKALASEILESGGLLISENEPGTAPIGPLFAKRDRIQAGLSAAIFAIETSSSGGTMHAVRASRSIQRTVYVPDPIAAGYDDLSMPCIEGTQQLIRENIAQPYTKLSYEKIINHVLRVSELLKEPPSAEDQGQMRI